MRASPPVMVPGPCQGHRKVDPEDQLGCDGQGHEDWAGPQGIPGEGQGLLANPGRLFQGRRGQLTALNRVDI